MVFLPVVFWTRGEILHTKRFKTHVARAGCSVGGTYLFYLAFALLPLALATTLTFLQAMFIIILAALLLGESIGPRRVVAVIVGFVGVVIVMRPGVVAFDPGMLVALAGAFVAALLIIITRSLSATEGRLTIMLFSACMGLAMISIPAAFTWRSIEYEHLSLLALVGAAGTTGQFLMVGAFQFAEASALAVVDYVRLIFAVAAGYVMFSEVPGLWTCIGAAVILGAVGYATHRERLAARAMVAAKQEPEQP